MSPIILTALSTVLPWPRWMRRARYSDSSACGLYTGPKCTKFSILLFVRSLSQSQPSSSSSGSCWYSILETWMSWRHEHIIDDKLRKQGAECKFWSGCLIWDQVWSHFGQDFMVKSWRSGSDAESEGTDRFLVRVCGSKANKKNWSYSEPRSDEMYQFWIQTGVSFWIQNPSISVFMNQSLTREGTDQFVITASDSDAN